MDLLESVRRDLVRRLGPGPRRVRGVVHRMQTAPDPTAVYRSFHGMYPKDDDPDPGLWVRIAEVGPDE
jgi:hypothetical protein